MNNIERFRNAFYKDNSKDTAVYISSVKNRFYLTDFHSSDGIVIITADKVYLFADSRYIEAAQKKVSGSEIIPILRDKTSTAKIKEFFKMNGIKNIAYEDNSLFCSEFESLKEKYSEFSFVPLKNTITKLRAIKSESELEKIRKAQSITDAAFEYILGRIDESRTEKDIALELEFFMRKNGADGIAFDTICVSGPNSSLPHGVPGDNKLCKNSFLTMDYGACFDGYCSDMTRTVCLGRASEEMKLVYNTVLTAQLAGLDAVKAGKIGKEVDCASRKVINDAGFGEYFGHSTGHSLGLDIHEWPNFAPINEDIFEKNIVMSVEPGIYLPGKFGVRIEDIVVVGDNGCENLTKSEKKLIEI